MKSRTKWLLLILVALAVGIQFVRPARTNPPEDPAKTIFADAAVWQDAPKTIERACLDCHSSRTRWPWYSQVAPVSWLVAHDVEEGREHFDMSNWATYRASRKSDVLEDIGKLVKNHSMPLPIYITLHGEAKLTEQERQEISAWAERARARVEIQSKE
ncbi:MAG: heme-binding domain-containing protein [Acidobacteria bacterium]|nr:heme-binding domain-containing protein [Acidobacteriota bacterium]MCL5289282.1 heme-binding domain-containing protein [Acidobacteriota bacterium]